MSDSCSNEFVVDANLFFRAYHDTYPPDVFPGFWRLVERSILSGQVVILDHGRREVKSPAFLIDMMERHRTRGIGTDAASMINQFGQLVNLVQADPQFTDVAKGKFRHDADGWIVAYALNAGSVVVTHEKFNPEARNRIPIPNLCNAHNVPWMDTVGMLRELGIEFELK